MFNRYFKLCGSITTGKIRSTRLLYILIDNWILPYGIPNYINYIDRERPPVCQKSIHHLIPFCAKKLTATAYHPRTNKQTGKSSDGDACSSPDCVIIFLSIEKWNTTAEPRPMCKAHKALQRKEHRPLTWNFNTSSHLHSHSTD